MKVKILQEGPYINPKIVRGKVRVKWYEQGDTESDWPDAYAEWCVEHELVKEVEETVEKEKEPEFNAAQSTIELAEEHGVDLSEVEGTGFDGRILKSDVEALLENNDG